MKAATKTRLVETSFKISAKMAMMVNIASVVIFVKFENKENIFNIIFNFQKVENLQGVREAECSLLPHIVEH